MALWPLLLQGIVLITLYHNFQLLSGSRGSNWKKLWPLKTREFYQYMICCSVHLVCDLGFLIYACLSTQFLSLATTYMWFACLFLCLKCFVFWVLWCVVSLSNSHPEKWCKVIAWVYVIYFMFLMAGCYLCFGLSHL